MADTLCTCRYGRGGEHHWFTSFDCYLHAAVRGRELFADRWSYGWYTRPNGDRAFVAGAKEVYRVCPHKGKPHGY